MMSERCDVWHSAQRGQRLQTERMDGTWRRRLRLRPPYSLEPSPSDHPNTGETGHQGLILHSELTETSPRFASLRWTRPSAIHLPSPCKRENNHSHLTEGSCYFPPLCHAERPQKNLTVFDKTILLVALLLV